jgi:hypothetical protein
MDDLGDRTVLLFTSSQAMCKSVLAGSLLYGPVSWRDVSRTGAQGGGSFHLSYAASMR